MLLVFLALLIAILILSFVLLLRVERLNDVVLELTALPDLSADEHIISRSAGDEEFITMIREGLAEQARRNGDGLIT